MWVGGWVGAWGGAWVGRWGCMGGWVGRWVHCVGGVGGCMCGCGMISCRVLAGGSTSCVLNSKFTWCVGG